MLSSDVPFNTVIIKMGEKIKNANNRHLVFDFTLAQFQRLFMRGTCAYSNKEFQSTSDMTIERLDPNIGYVHGNCVLVCNRLNQARKPLDEFLKDVRVDDEDKVRMLEFALKTVKKRVVEAGRAEQEAIMAKQIRASNLAMMANDMKRKRFTTVTPANGESPNASSC